jgi:septal ring factor EnvC (AmiA/AmiB activator)
MDKLRIKSSIKLSSEAFYVAFKRSKSAVGLLWAAGLLFVLSNTALAEDEETTPARVQEINETVEKYSHDLLEKQQKQKSIEENYNRVKQEVKLIMLKQGQLKKEFESAKAQLDGVNKEIELAADNIESMERRYAARIRVLYMQRSEDFLENIFLVSDQTTLKRNAYFMSRIKESDQKIIADLYSKKKDQETKIADMNKILKTKEDLHDKVSLQTKILNSKLSEQENILKESTQQKANLEQTIASLKAQSLRIETVITSLTGKEKQDKGGKKQESIKQSLSGGKLEAFSGAGLEGLKGRLTVPVDGAVIKDIKQGDNVPIGKILGVKGLLYSVAPGAPVDAVERGKVIFNSTMPGRGKMIIIDHGQRSYSLYGKLSDTQVNLQQEVSKGDVIAHTEQKPEGGDSEFYFEIRKNGIAVDTKSYLKSH